ncbi:transglutaminase family protein, partial [Acinetobacter baumannii]
VFLRSSPLTSADAGIRALAETAGAAAADPLGRLHALNRLMAERMRFDATGMDVRRTAADALAMGHGVCQDFTHVFVAAAREMD